MKTKKEKERINNEGIAARYIALAFLHTGRRADFHFQLYSDVLAYSWRSAGTMRKRDLGSPWVGLYYFKGF